MAEPVSLSRARKARKLLKKRNEADANAAKFGRTKAERERDDRIAENTRRHLDGHQRDPE